LFSQSVGENCTRVSGNKLRKVKETPQPPCERLRVRRLRSGSRPRWAGGWGKAAGPSRCAACCVIVGKWDIYAAEDLLKLGGCLDSVTAWRSASRLGLGTSWRSGHWLSCSQFAPSLQPAFSGGLQRWPGAGCSPRGWRCCSRAWKEAIRSWDTAGSAWLTLVPAERCCSSDFFFLIVVFNFWVKGNGSDRRGLSERFKMVAGEWSLVVKSKPNAVFPFCESLFNLLLMEVPDSNLILETWQFQIPTGAARVRLGISVACCATPRNTFSTPAGARTKAALGCPWRESPLSVRRHRLHVTLRVGQPWSNTRVRWNTGGMPGRSFSAEWLQRMIKSWISLAKPF